MRESCTDYAIIEDNDDVKKTGDKKTTRRESGYKSTDASDAESDKSKDDYPTDSFLQDLEPHVSVN